MESFKLSILFILCCTFLNVTGKISLRNVFNNIYIMHQQTKKKQKTFLDKKPKIYRIFFYS